MSHSKIMLTGYHKRYRNRMDGGALYVWSSRHDGSPPPAGHEAVISAHGREGTNLLDTLRHIGP
jgi:hypothetical protein